jgi:uncharacterized protein YndB with AHSA1/START domain
MPVCENDARAGGEFRYEWVKADGSAGFSITGEILEIEPGKRIVHVERMHMGEGVGLRLTTGLRRDLMLRGRGR